MSPIYRPGTGMGRKTIAGYLRALQVVGVQPGGPPPTDAQLTVIMTARRPGRPSNTDVPSPEVDALRPHAAQIHAWLTENLRLTKMEILAVNAPLFLAGSRIRCATS